MNKETHLKDHKKISLKLPIIIGAFLIIVILGFLTMRAPERKSVIQMMKITDLLICEIPMILLKVI